MGWRGPIFHFHQFFGSKVVQNVEKWKLRKKGAELFHPQFLVLRLQTVFYGMRKKRLQSVKLESSQSDTDRLRNNSGQGYHQTDTLLGKMKIT